MPGLRSMTSISRNAALAAALLVAAALIAADPSSAAGRMGKKSVIGSFTYRYGDSESLSQAKETCLKLALKRALESAMIYIHSDVRIDAGGLTEADIRSLAAGCLEDVEVLQERVQGRNVTYRLRAFVDPVQLEESIHKGIRQRPHRHTTRPVRIAFHDAHIAASSHYGADDTVASPDTYVVVKNRQGNVIFRTCHFFMENHLWDILLLNRDNYAPSFAGAWFQYTMADDDYLEVYLVDWDGIEGPFGLDASRDDMIGGTCRVTSKISPGRHTLKARGWQLTVEVF